MIIQPLARERVDNACDIGSPTSQLKDKWSVHKHIDFSLLTKDIWWHSPKHEVFTSNYQDSFKLEPWKEPFGKFP